MNTVPRLCPTCRRHPSACVCSEMPTKPSVITLPDYRARLAAYRAASESEAGSLDGPVTTWDAVNTVIEAYLAARGDQAKREVEMLQHEMEMQRQEFERDR